LSHLQKSFHAHRSHPPCICPVIEVVSMYLPLHRAVGEASTGVWGASGAARACERCNKRVPQLSIRAGSKIRCEMKQIAGPSPRARKICAGQIISRPIANAINARSKVTCSKGFHLVTCASELGRDITQQGAILHDDTAGRTVHHSGRLHAPAMNEPDYKSVRPEHER
jgi:hypothetical protein